MYVVSGFSRTGNIVVSGFSRTDIQLTFCEPRFAG
jgi:hypothetical protein